MVAENRARGDLIFLQGRPADCRSCLQSGWARLVTDQFTVLANLGAGSPPGEADTLAGASYTISAGGRDRRGLWVLGAAILGLSWPTILRSSSFEDRIWAWVRIRRSHGHLRRLEC